MPEFVTATHGQAQLRRDHGHLLPAAGFTAQRGFQVDLHPDQLRLAVSRFQPNGRGGNGRHVTPETYVGNHGVIDIYHLYEQPAVEGDTAD